MKVVIYLCVSLALVALCSKSVGARLHSAEWEAYKEQHGKYYEDLTEDLQRYANYLATKKLIQEHNSAQSASSFRMELNHMADWSMDEFTGRSPAIVVNKANGLGLLQSARFNFSVALPENLDWRKDQDYQIVGPVGNQGKCASSWAFAAAGVVEGQEFLNEISKFSPLSAQNILDCSRYNNGCKGGLVQVALEEMANYHGIDSDASYPYTGKQAKKCGFKPENAATRLDGMEVLQHVDEKALLRWLFHFGPVAIEIDATDRLRSYKGGVFDDPSCKKKGPNHSVLIVGYGTDKQAGDFWIVKNSWSTKWGEQGYFRLKRGINACGILQNPTVPLFL